jgi:hypothetical protein
MQLNDKPEAKFEALVPSDDGFGPCIHLLGSTHAIV